MKVALKNLFLFNKLNRKWKINTSPENSIFPDLERIVGAGHFEFYVPINYGTFDDIKIYYPIKITNKMNVTIGDVLNAIYTFYSQELATKQDLVNVSQLPQMKEFSEYHLGKIQQNKKMHPIHFYEFLKEQLYFKNIIHIGENVYVLTVTN